MRTHCVVLTFPGHFLQTYQCIQQIKNLDAELAITVLIDDISNKTWPGYIQDCEKLYQEPCTFLSTVDFLDPWSRNPWIRQQIVKLYLDKILAFEGNVFFIDGDVLLHNFPPMESVPYTTVKYSGVPLSQRDPHPGEVSSQQIFYVNHMLHVDEGRLFINDEKYIGTSGCPFRDLELGLLPQLRGYVEHINGKNFSQLHLDIADDTRYSVSEWELIEVYKQQILRRKLNLVKCDKSVFHTTWSCDVELGQNYFGNSIPDLETWWHKLPNTKY